VLADGDIRSREMSRAPCQPGLLDPGS
jgi:hypothetical protein